MLGRYAKRYALERPLKENKLPVILSEIEVRSILWACSNLKHKALLYLTYAAGLRRREVINLKIYTHVGTKGLEKIRSPLDNLDI